MKVKVRASACVKVRKGLVKFRMKVKVRMIVG